MNLVLSRAVTPLFSALAGALLLAGCTTGVDVGHDGQAGTGAAPSQAATGAGGAGGAGGAVPFGAACTNPAALLCPWGWIGGPCGGSKPFAKDCQQDQGWICVGATADTEGTCVLSGDDVASPGDACGAGVPGSRVCPWNYRCDAPIASDGMGHCVPGTCVLGDGTVPTSAASLTIDGDGPTQHYDFACSLRWGSTQTGEATAHVMVTKGSPPGSDVLFLSGCASPDGNPYLGSLELQVPLTAPGTAMAVDVSYVPPNFTQNFLTMGDPATVTVTGMDANHVRGSYDAIVQGAAGPGPENTRHLTGTFDVCHLPFHDDF